MNGTTTPVPLSPRGTFRRIWEAAGLPSPTPRWLSRSKDLRAHLNRRVCFCFQPGFSARCWYRAAGPGTTQAPPPVCPANSVAIDDRSSGFRGWFASGVWLDQRHYRRFLRNLRCRAIGEDFPMSIGPWITTDPFARPLGRGEFVSRNRSVSRLNPPGRLSR